MIRALQTAASSMLANQQAIETTANNLSNVNTTGFKKGRAEFQELLYAQVQPAAEGKTPGLVIGQGVRLNQIHRIQDAGMLQPSENPYDLAIQGLGFFRIQQPDGTVAYTRDGAFSVDAQGRLATASGGLVLGQSGPIVIPADATNVSIKPDGFVEYQSAEGKTLVAGQITLALFTNPAGLTPVGHNLHAASTGASRPQVLTPGSQAAGKIVQKHLEASNVQTMEEMVNLMAAQRAYELNAKVIHSTDEMMSMANNLRRG